MISYPLQDGWERWLTMDLIDQTLQARAFPRSCLGLILPVVFWVCRLADQLPRPKANGAAAIDRVGARRLAMGLFPIQAARTMRSSWELESLSGGSRSREGPGVEGVTPQQAEEVWAKAQATPSGCEPVEARERAAADRWAGMILEMNVPIELKGLDGLVPPGHPLEITNDKNEFGGQLRDGNAGSCRRWLGSWQTTGNVNLLSQSYVTDNTFSAGSSLPAAVPWSALGRKAHDQVHAGSCRPQPTGAAGHRCHCLRALAPGYVQIRAAARIRVQADVPPASGGSPLGGCPGAGLLGRRQVLLASSSVAVRSNPQEEVACLGRERQSGTTSGMRSDEGADWLSRRVGLKVGVSRSSVFYSVFLEEREVERETVWCRYCS